MNRRRFLERAAVAASTATVAGLAGWRHELHNLEIVELPLPIATLPSELEGARLVQISDLHVGSVVNDEYVRHALDTVGSLKPDIIAFTGDFVTWEGTQQLAQLEGVLQAFPKATLGAVGVLGNHDYGFRWRQTSVADSISALAVRHGIQVLRNAVCTINGLTIIGIDDWWAGQTSVSATRALTKAGAASLVLCHNPDVADSLEWQGYRGWMLSGHTHGGQCRAPFCAPPILPVANRRYAAGQVALVDGRTVYINRGVGHTLPIRVLVRPEITSFRLVRA